MQFIGLSILLGLSGLVFFVLARQKRRQLIKEYALDKPDTDHVPARRVAPVTPLLLTGPTAASAFEAVMTGSWRWWALFVVLVVIVAALQIWSRMVARRQVPTA